MTLFQAFGQFAGAGAAVVPLGFQFITSTTFSAASSVSVDNCFSADYDEYLILRSFTGSAVDFSVDMRLRAGGSDASGSNYYQQYLTANNTTAAGDRNPVTTTAKYALGYQNSTATGSLLCTIQHPFNAAPTAIISETDTGLATNIQWAAFATIHDVSTSYDGFTAIPESGNITGTLYVYGWGK